MARARVIQTRILDTPHIEKYGYLGNYFFIGLILNADDAGRLRDNPSMLRSCIFPVVKERVRVLTVQKWLTTMHEDGMILRYNSTSGDKLIQICNWKNYQKISHPTPSKIPAPDSGEPPEKFRRTSGASPTEGKERGKDLDLKSFTPEDPQSLTISSGGEAGERPEKPVTKSSIERGEEALRGGPRAVLAVPKNPDHVWPHVEESYGEALRNMAPELQAIALRDFKRRYGWDLLTGPGQ